MGTVTSHFTDRSPEVPYWDPNTNKMTSFVSTSHDRKAMAMDSLVSSRGDYMPTPGTSTGLISLRHDDNSVSGHLVKSYPVS